MSIDYEPPRKTTVLITTLKPGDTYETIRNRNLFLVSDLANEDEGFPYEVIDLLTGRAETIEGDDENWTVIPVDLILTKRESK